MQKKVKLPSNFQEIEKKLTNSPCTITAFWKIKNGNNSKCALAATGKKGKKQKKSLGICGSQNPSNCGND